MPVVVRELVAAGAKVMAETPPAPELEGLRSLWRDVGASGLVQVGEQYTRMPGHASRLAVVHAGVIGSVTSVEVASTHLYHAVSLIRAFLGVDMDPVVVNARTFTGPARRPVDLRRLADGPEARAQDHHDRHARLRSTVGWGSTTSSTTSGGTR